MKKESLFTVFSLLAVFGMVTMASAGSVDWQYFTHASVVGTGPGADLLMGTTDDAADASNAPGSYSLTYITWDPLDPTCGPPSVTYMTGIEVDCLGTPTAGQFTATYLDVVQTEPIPGVGPIQIKLTAGGSPNTGNRCGLGTFQATKDTTMYMGGLPILPMDDTVVDGKVIDATVPVASSYTCLTTTYTQGYLESIRQLLPGSATSFMVTCAAINFGPLPLVPCLNNSASGSTAVLWTDDPLNCGSTCCDNDGDDYDGSQCSGTDCLDTNPAVNPAGTEICGNGFDDDCVGGDEACPPGSCAGGPVE
jgi:hypothetical protein